MPDSDKVIKGLQCIIDGTVRCESCGYAIDKHGHHSCQQNCAADAIALLKEQDAKTGHWIEKEDYNLDTYYDCSVCGESWTMIDGTLWENGMNYCPNCGAKMEGRRNRRI